MLDFGNSYLNIFVHISSYLPLLPFLLILLKRTYVVEYLNYLMILSLVAFLFNLTLNFIPFYSKPFHFLRNVLMITEVMLILLMINSRYKSSFGKHLTITLLVFVPNMSVTYMLINSLNEFNTLLITLNCAILLISALLFQKYLMDNYKGNILNYSLFWIMNGVFMFCGSYLIFNLGRKFIFNYDTDDYKSMWGMIYIVHFIKYGFFALAAFMGKPADAIFEPSPADQKQKAELLNYELSPPEFSPPASLAGNEVWLD